MTEIVKLKGVYYFPDRNIYRTKINVNKKVIHLGYFEDPHEAKRVYDAAKESAKKGLAIVRPEIAMGENGKRRYRHVKKERAPYGSRKKKEIENPEDVKATIPSEVVPSIEDAIANEQTA